MLSWVSSLRENTIRAHGRTHVLSQLSVLSQLTTAEQQLYRASRLTSVRYLHKAGCRTRIGTVYTAVQLLIIGEYGYSKPLSHYQGPVVLLTAVLVPGRSEVA